MGSTPESLPTLAAAPPMIEKSSTIRGNLAGQCFLQSTLSGFCGVLEFLTFDRITSIRQYTLVDEFSSGSPSSFRELSDFTRSFNSIVAFLLNNIFIYKSLAAFFIITCSEMP